MSDILIRNVLKQAACAEYILQVIMGDQTLRVLECVVQKDYKNLQGRSAVLDCVIRDTRGKLLIWRSSRRVRERRREGRAITAACWI